MRRFKSILFFAEDTEASRLALERAVSLAQRNQGSLTVLGVLKTLPRELRRLTAALPWEDLEEMALGEVRERLESLVAPFQPLVSPLNVEGHYGKPFIEISRSVLRGQHDLVILAAESNGGVRGTLFGSISLHLMRKCPCPVWVLNPRLGPRIARILAAVDPDSVDVVRDGVNTRILELAISLAQEETSKLHLVHAWELCDRNVLRGWRAKVPEAQMAAWVEQTREAHQQRLGKLIAQYDMGTLKHQVHLVAGESGSVIPRLAQEHQVDLIVMGTMARSGLDGYFIGNTAETVLQHVACSVLTVKPDGFVSPIKPA